MTESDPTWWVLAATINCVIFVFIYLAVHLVGVIKVFQQLESKPAYPKMGLAAWIIGGVGAFTGPCVMPLNLVGLVVGIIALVGGRDLAPEANLPAKIGVASSIVILLMGGILLAILAIGGFLG